MTFKGDSTALGKTGSVECKCGSVSWNGEMSLVQSDAKLVVTVPKANTVTPKQLNTEVVCGKGTITCTARVWNAGVT
jgi:hypothetical protein